MATDNEGIVTVTYDPSTINVNDFKLVTATATDAAGNTATCDFTVFGLTGKWIFHLVFFADFICGARGGAEEGGTTAS